MRPSIKDFSTCELAFQTGHKLTNIHRAFVSPIVGMVYFAKLDNGPLQRITDIRSRLESEYLELESKQGKPATLTIGPL